VLRIVRRHGLIGQLALTLGLHGALVGKSRRG